ncbi:universal stress protein [Mesorhizobium sp.]|uniref:universal stress protein n=1 Tax=Mesorhizobium sp. TaxID=1871066 RepID=UPI000FE6204A|nr:universal stress protein [Mesorhizobium sp.]RWM08748.1 MAG: universal stress protein [Mesorhizobium sp.]RWM22463.1 MAG: universal stress protein [Mesorhizobium sp.]RWM31251.1 MAG: universal stress protein [Mesorhizobium sp.]TIO53648.1 MAG: universal stress protein [Mesorhizobium sp.]TIO58566.1 MAG: universal stress protein [Mesorhizobium sp.]
MQLLASLFLPTYPDPPGPKVASNAVAVAKQIAATLDAAVINVDIPDVSNALSSFLLDLPAKIREVEAASRNSGKALLETVAAEAARCNVTLTRQELKAQPALIGEAAAREGRYFDLCLVGWTANNETARMTVEEVVFSSGRPTLILPDGRDVGALDHVVIAWDGSRVAARAVADARPFLERASAISILTVTDEKVLPGKDIAERLAHGFAARGLRAKAGSIQIGNNEIGIALQEHALKIGGNLLVMGGWGHSRLRDVVLGGATEGILSDLRLPVLMSH